MQGTYEALKRETENDEFEVDDPKAKWVGLLEKKWTSVIRLQKKVRAEGLVSAACLEPFAPPYLTRPSLCHSRVRQAGRC
jgi:platelet-activating factor acetylhydrolase IB subunit alpha